VLRSAWHLRRWGSWSSVRRRACGWPLTRRHRQRWIAWRGELGSSGDDGSSARQRQGNLSSGAESGPTRGERNGSPSLSDTWFSISVVCCPSRDRDELFAAVGCQGAASTPTMATTGDMDPFLRGGGGDEEDPGSVDLRWRKQETWSPPRQHLAARRASME
jgi:hypothetical protein